MTNDPEIPSTPRTLISTVRSGGQEAAEEALGKLCEAYLYPAYGLVRKFGCDPTLARDFTHDFFAEVLASNGRLVKKWRPEKGKFRAYFRTCLKNAVSQIRRGQRARKRGAGKVDFSLKGAEEAFVNRGSDGASPDLIFDMLWADQVLGAALRRLQSEMLAMGRASDFDLLKVSLMGMTPDYSELERVTGKDRGALRVEALRFRQRFLNTLRAEIRSTVSLKADQAEIEEELRFLGSLIGRQAR